MYEIIVAVYEDIMVKPAAKGAALYLHLLLETLFMDDEKLICSNFF